jgi:hypothetical protein
MDSPCLKTTFLLSGDAGHTLDGKLVVSSEHVGGDLGQDAEDGSGSTATATRKMVSLHD